MFISYSHDGPLHAEAVHRVSDRLRTDGVDCDLDAYHMSPPPEGWPAWMEKGLTDASFALVICSDGYRRKLEADPIARVGLGVSWEGAIVRQAIYEAGGRNEKFIPVLLKESDSEFVPRFLRGTTRYNIGDEPGYIDLYRRLTNQPAIVKPALGKIRIASSIGVVAAGAGATIHSPAHEAWSDVVGLMSDGGFRFFNDSTATIRGADAAIVTVRADDDADSAYLADLSSQKQRPIGVGIRGDAFLATVTSVRRSVGGQSDIHQIDCIPIASDYGAGIMEISTTEFSADRLAEFRARRILLNESGLPESRRNKDELNDAMLELFIRGQSAPIKISGSFIPQLYRDLGDDPAKFIAVARVMSTMLLRFSGAIERVRRLDFEIDPETRVRVRFEGTRHRKYDNLPPTVIEVAGVLDCSPPRQT